MPPSRGWMGAPGRFGIPTQAPTALPSWPRQVRNGARTCCSPGVWHDPPCTEVLECTGWHLSPSLPPQNSLLLGNPISIRQPKSLDICPALPRPSGVHGTLHPALSPTLVAVQETGEGMSPTLLLGREAEGGEVMQ